MLKRLLLILSFLSLQITFLEAQGPGYFTSGAAGAGQYRTDEFGNKVDQFGNQVDPNSIPESLNDSTVEVVSLAPKLRMWKITERLGDLRPTDVDTLSLNFQNTNQDYGMTGEYNYLGNLGLPRLSRIFSQRSKDEASTIFLTPYSIFFSRPQDHFFTNSNVPYTNLTYFKAGNKVTGEERFKSYFSVNAGKRLSFGFKFDYLYGRGYYANQSTSDFNAGLFASYIGKQYQLHAIYNNFYLKSNENGGVQDDRYITNPEDMASGGKTYESNNIPVNLESTSNRNHNAYLYLTHRYALGFSRTVTSIQDAEPAPGDTIPRKDTIQTEEYVPVTSFIHTMKLERSRHSFHSGETDKPFFPEGGIDNWHQKDSTKVLSVENTLGLSLLEGFNKYAKAGLTAYLTHKLSSYTLMNLDSKDPFMDGVNMKEHELKVGGELKKEQGRVLHYSVMGSVGIAGISKGEYALSAKGNVNLPIGKWDTLKVDLSASHTNLLPSFYMRHYHSNYHSWDLDLDKEARTRLEASLRLPKAGTNIILGVENVKNYTYFGSSSLPLQEAENIKVAEATLKQDIRVGIFHLDNVLTYQKSSNKQVLPLPALSAYHNLYVLTKVFKKVLTLQIGADVRYFSKYKAPAYSPGIQNFRLQSDEESMNIGGYPIVNVYANLHLKRTRIFVEMYHINAGSGSRQYFLAPHYPISGRSFKLGVSWNFYD